MPDGTFCEPAPLLGPCPGETDAGADTEVRIGGPHGSTQSLKWLPFGKPQLADEEKNRPSQQLTQLLERITGDADYLMSFFDMVNGSIAAMPYPPREYADFASSVVGKPLALANIGYSLELAEPPFEAQNTLPPGDHIQRIHPNETLDKYDFPVKIGDYSRPFDGLVAYFDMKEDAPAPGGNPDTPLTREEVDLEIMHTYFLDRDASQGSSHDRRRPIGFATDGTEMSGEYPTVTPYWIDPLPRWQDLDGRNPYADFAAEHYKRYHVKAVLVDPYTPIHIYSPILPVKALQLPAWTVQSACRKMTAFFHLGPMLITRDVAPFAQVQKAVADISGGAQADVPPNPPLPVVTDPTQPPPVVPAPPSISIPMSVKNKWRWLQPYVQGDGDGRHTEFGSLPIVEEDGKPKFPPAPYTAVEGYLQLLEGIVKPEPVPQA